MNNVYFGGKVYGNSLNVEAEENSVLLGDGNKGIKDSGLTYLKNQRKLFDCIEPIEENGEQYYELKIYLVPEYQGLAKTGIINIGSNTTEGSIIIKNIDDDEEIEIFKERIKDFKQDNNPDESETFIVSEDIFNIGTNKFYKEKQESNNIYWIIDNNTITGEEPSTSIASYKISENLSEQSYLNYSISVTDLINNFQVYPYIKYKFKADKHYKITILENQDLIHNFMVNEKYLLKYNINYDEEQSNIVSIDIDIDNTTMIDEFTNSLIGSSNEFTIEGINKKLQKTYLTIKDNAKVIFNENSVFNCLDSTQFTINQGAKATFSGGTVFNCSGNAQFTINQGAKATFSGSSIFNCLDGGQFTINQGAKATFSGGTVFNCSDRAKVTFNGGSIFNCLNDASFLIDTNARAVLSGYSQFIINQQAKATFSGASIFNCLDNAEFRISQKAKAYFSNESKTIIESASQLILHDNAQLNLDSNAQVTFHDNIRFSMTGTSELFILDSPRLYISGKSKMALNGFNHRQQQSEGSFSAAPVFTMNNDCCLMVNGWSEYELIQHPERRQYGPGLTLNPNSFLFSGSFKMDGSFSPSESGERQLPQLSSNKPAAPFMFIANDSAVIIDGNGRNYIKISTQENDILQTYLFDSTYINSRSDANGDLIIDFASSSTQEKTNPIGQKPFCFRNINNSISYMAGFQDSREGTWIQVHTSINNYNDSIVIRNIQIDDTDTLWTTQSLEGLLNNTSYNLLKINPAYTIQNGGLYEEEEKICDVEIDTENKYIRFGACSKEYSIDPRNIYFRVSTQNKKIKIDCSSPSETITGDIRLAVIIGDTELTLKEAKSASNLEVDLVNDKWEKQSYTNKFLPSISDRVKFIGLDTEIPQDSKYCIGYKDFDFCIGTDSKLGDIEDSRNPGFLEFAQSGFRLFTNGQAIVLRGSNCQFDIKDNTKIDLTGNFKLHSETSEDNITTVTFSGEEEEPTVSFTLTELQKLKDFLLTLE